MIYREYFSPKMEKNVTYYLDILENEQLIAFIDLTFFGEGKKGLICTTERFVKFDKKSKTELFLKDISMLEAREVNPATYEYALILTDISGKEHDLTCTSIPNDELKVFVYIICKALNLRHTS